MWVKPGWIPCKQGSWVRAWESRLPLCWETTSPSRRAPLAPVFTSPGICGRSTVLFSWQQKQVIKTEDGVQPLLWPTREGGKKCNTECLLTLIFILSLRGSTHNRLVFSQYESVLNVPLSSLSFLNGRPEREVIWLKTVKIPSNFIWGLYLLQNWMWVTCQATKLTSGVSWATTSLAKMTGHLYHLSPFVSIQKRKKKNVPLLYFLLFF